MGTARARKPGGELIQVALADRDRARRRQALDDRCGARGHVGECRARRRGLLVRHVDIVLDGERYAGERQALSGRESRVDASRPCQHCLATAALYPSLRLDAVVVDGTLECLERRALRAEPSRADRADNAPHRQPHGLMHCRCSARLWTGWPPSVHRG
jgi:hypothetical protein